MYDSSRIINWWRDLVCFELVLYNPNGAIRKPNIFFNSNTLDPLYRNILSGLLRRFIIYEAGGSAFIQRYKNHPEKAFVVVHDEECKGKYWEKNFPPKSNIKK